MEQFSLLLHIVSAMTGRLYFWCQLDHIPTDSTALPLIWLPPPSPFCRPQALHRARSGGHPVLRRPVPRHAPVPRRVPVPAAEHLHDHSERPVQAQHPPVSVHQRFPPGHVEPQLERLHHPDRPAQLHGQSAAGEACSASWAVRGGGLGSDGSQLHGQSGEAEIRRVSASWSVRGG